MGVVIDPGSAQFSYGGFHRFREMVAEAEGLVLDDMIGFGYGYAESKQAGTIPWCDDDSKPRTVLEPFLNHSDCEGFISSWQCGEMWPRLLEIVDSWSSDDESVGFYKGRGRSIVDGMRFCAENHCAMEFS